jgi:16S rRNA (cytidine1402-2'-O)-methyltransferase
MSNSGILYIVATPIGNLSDITLRALETLKAVDFIACEDTRVTVKLLNHYSIKKPLISFHQHSKLGKIDAVISKLKEGNSIALVTDAGTPGISDPGNQLIAEAIKNDIKTIPIPGPSALAAIVSIAGIDMQRFVFLGFPPHKKGREKYFKEVASLEYPVIYYESPYRIIKNLELLASLAPQKSVIVGRELTKLFEEVIRGPIEFVAKSMSQKKAQIKGEMTVIVY